MTDDRPDRLDWLRPPEGPHRRAYLDGWTDALAIIRKELDAGLDRASLVALDANMDEPADHSAEANAAVNVMVDDRMAGQDIEDYAELLVTARPSAASYAVVLLVDALVIAHTGRHPALERINAMEQRAARSESR